MTLSEQTKFYSFQIKVANNDITSGTIPLTWCVDIETLNFLYEQKITDPQLVIITVSPSNKTNRYVVALKDLIKYVEFTEPGIHKIWSFISFKSNQDACSVYLYKIHGKYGTDLLNYNKTKWSRIFNYVPDSDDFKPTISAETIQVDVPIESFATEPPEWEKAWVNYHFDTPCYNQCQYRKRRIFAYTLQILLFLLDYIFRSILFSLAFVYGSKGLSFKYFLKPLTYNILDCIEGLFYSGSYFIIDNNFRSLFKNISNKISKTENLVSETEKLENKVWYLQKEEIKLLSCENKPDTISINDLPRKYRTFKLRYQDLKSKVCKPFAR